MTITPQNNNTPTETITLNWFEINALLKLLHFVKFKCDDFEADIFRGSPLINEVFRKVLAIAPDREYRYTTLNTYIMEMIEARLTDNEYYNNLTDKEKETYLAVLAYPYPLKKVIKTMTSTIKQLQQLGKMPNEDLDNDGTDVHNLVAQYETLLNEIEEPISFEDAYVLLSILPDTKCYGLEEIIEGKIESIELDNEESIEAYDKLINSCTNKEVKDFLIVGFENWKEKQ